MNPSAAEIVAAIDATPAEEVLVLPNNSNVVLTAEQAAGLSSKAVRVIPSRSVQAGLAAMGRYIPTNSPEENEEDMLEALASVAHGRGHGRLARRGARRRDDREGRVPRARRGRGRRRRRRLRRGRVEVVRRVLDGEQGWLGILTGEGAPPVEELLAAVNAAHPEVDVEVHDGGQPHYPLLLVAE